MTVSVPSRLVLHDLERKVDRLTESALASSHLQEEDSISSGVDSLKADLEEDIQTSISLAKKHGEERLESERRRHSEALDSLEREVSQSVIQSKFPPWEKFCGEKRTSMITIPTRSV